MKEIATDTIEEVVGTLEELKKSMSATAEAITQEGDMTETLFCDEKLQKSMDSEFLEGITLYVGTEMNHTREALRKSMEAQSLLVDGISAMFKSMSGEIRALKDQIESFGNAPRVGFKSVTAGAQVLEKSMSGAEETAQPKYPRFEKMTKSMVSAKLSALFEQGKVPVGILSKFDAAGPDCLNDQVKTLLENS